MATRRSFLRTSGAAVACASLLPRGIHRILSSGSLAILKGDDLFFGSSDVERMRTLYASEIYSPLRSRIATIDREAERRFLQDEVRYNDQLYDIARVANRSIEMAFHYLMTGDKDAAELAVLYMRSLPKFERWDYFLEAGTKVFGLQRAPACTVATSLCWDWLEDYADETERREWIQLMGERGCEPSWLALYGMRHPDRVEGWSMDESSTYFEHRPGDRVDLSNWPHILDRTNLKAVPASALAIGAVAYAREMGEDDRAKKWLEQAVYSLRTFRDLYAVDGSYDEGVSYANYTSSHITQATVALERYNGLSLYDELNWSGYVDYLCNMSMATARSPTGIVNFGDAGNGATASVPYWVAQRTGDSRARWFGDALSREKDMWSLIWHPDDSVRPAASKSGLVLWQSALDWMVARTGYRPDDLVVAMRSGGPANHEHADRNSIIVKWGGEVLVADPYRPPYSYADPSWMMRTTAGHSALLVDGEGHQYHDGSEGTNPSDSVARIVRRGERDGYVFWTSDASPAYTLVDPDIQSVTRSVYVFEGTNAVLIVDKVRKDATPSIIEARFFGDNRKVEGANFSTESGGDTPVRSPAAGCRITAGEMDKHAFAEIARPLASAHIASVSPQGAIAAEERLPIPPDVAALHPFAAMRTTEPSAGPLLISVVVPYAGSRKPSVSFNMREDGSTDVVVEHGVGMVRCSVVDSGSIPEVIVNETR